MSLYMQAIRKCGASSAEQRTGNLRGVFIVPTHTCTCTMPVGVRFWTDTFRSKTTLLRCLDCNAENSTVHTVDTRWWSQFKNGVILAPVYQA